MRWNVATSMGDQLTLPHVPTEQRIVPDARILMALAAQGAPTGLAVTIATAATMGADVEFYDRERNPFSEFLAMWVIRDVPASMHEACNAVMKTWTSDDSWLWVPNPNKVPSRGGR